VFCGPGERIYGPCWRVSGTLIENGQNRPLVLAILGDGGFEDLVLGVLEDDWY